MDTGRRGFLFGKYFTQTGREELQRNQSAQGPMPPWHSQISTDECRHCTAPCVSSCEPGIIKRHSKDHELEGIPYLTFTEAGCNFCGACATACPLDINTDLPPSLGEVTLNTSSCLSWSGVTCISCRNYCDYDALSLDNRGHMLLDSEKCTGCGCCLAACPSNSISFHIQIVIL